VSSYPFHGIHQAGVLTPGPAAKQSFSCFAAFDSIAASKSDLAELMRVNYRAVRGFLHLRPAPHRTWASAQPPSDSDGPRGPPSPPTA